MQLNGNNNKSCCSILRSEFTLKNFNFNHDQQDQFYRSQWQRSERSWLFLIYRWMWAIFFISVFISCLILQFANGKYFIFLTNWGIILCMLTQLLAAILVTRWHFDLGSLRTEQCDRNSREQKSPTMVKIYWLLYDVTLPLALVITTIYWTFLHGKMNKPQRFPVISFVTHCLNSVFMLVDFFMVAFPVRLLHTIYAMLLPIIFCFFTVIYFFCGGTDEYGNHFVYPLLDWKIPIRGVVTFIGVFCLYCIFPILLFVFFKLKQLLHRSLNIVWSPHCVGLI
ncbi:hypothetical protein DOY81_002601 [Sarcophaga bullata]|nr:hypothetical protein DOY81_002601 [Sarcophaga bullata]